MIEKGDLPNSWELKKLSELGTMLNGKTLAKKDIKGGNYPVYGANGIIGYHTEFFVDEDCIAVCQRGATTGAVNTVDSPAWVTGNSTIYWPSGINFKYINYYLQHYNFERLTKKSTIKMLSQKDLKSIKVPVPPLDEQERIVEAVEERLERVERLEKSVENVGRLADEYYNSYLAHVLLGVEDNSREYELQGLPNSDNDNIEYDVLELGKVVNYHSNLTNPNEEPDKLYDLVELNDIEKDAGRITNIQKKKGDSIGSNKREFTDNHVLYCKLRPYLNKVVKPDFSGIASSELLVLEPSNRITKDYLYFYLSSPMVRNKAEFLMKGANQPRLSKSELMCFNIPVPPLEVQQKIVEDVKRIRRSKLKKSVTDVRSLFEEYRDSVLAHAFKGHYT